MPPILSICCHLSLAILAQASAAPNASATSNASAPSQPAGPNTAPVVHEAIIQAAPAALWDVWTTSEGFKVLGPAHADVDLKIGGLIRAHYNPQGVLGDPGTVQNVILAFEPLRMLTIRIQQPPEGFPFMNVYDQMWTVVTQTDLGDGRTHVRIAAHGFTAAEESQAMRRFFDQGNLYTLRRLQAHFDAASAAAVPARAHQDDPLAPIELAVLVAAPRADVYKAYTTTDGWKTFFGIPSHIELRPGGPFELYFGPDAPAGERGSEGCTVLAYVPDEMFSYTWNAPPNFAHARGRSSWVVVSFESVSAASTRVRLRHLGLAELAAAEPEHADEFKQVRAYFAQAWPYVLKTLQTHFDKGA